MRDFFINALEYMIHFIVVILIIGVVLASLAIMSGQMPADEMGQSVSGVPMGIAALIGGLLYVVFVAGFMYLGLGIYQNTKKTSELLQLMAARDAT